MKLTVSGAGSGREQTRERQRRDRASTQLLRIRYPQFTSLRLDFDFSGNAPFTPVPQVTVLHPPARAYFVFPCPYVDCDGEFDLSAAVDRLARAGDGIVRGQMQCCGKRSLGRTGRPVCELTLDYSLVANPE